MPILAFFTGGLSPLAWGTLMMVYGLFVFERFIPAGAGNTDAINTGSMAPPVYPRWRGEHLTVVIAPSMSAGLSPLARGTH